MKPLISCSAGLNSYLNLHKLGELWINVITFIFIVFIALFFKRAKQRLILLWLRGDNHKVKTIAKNLGKEERWIWKILTWNIIFWLIVLIFCISPWMVEWSCNLEERNWFTVIGGLIVLFMLFKKPESE